VTGLLQTQGIYFNDLTGVIYPQKPLIFGNVMVVSKRHVEFFYAPTDAEIVEMRNIVKRIFEGFKENYNANGFNLFTNNGKSAGQHIPHVHWHILMQFDGEPYSPYDVLNGKVKEKV
jgi:diadenosine tetraphosphate (Ap4A) HIT family hydrolase